MEKYKEVIPIFFAVDDGYIPFLAVTLQSIVEKSKEEYYYVVKILYTNISEENKEKINKYKRENIEIEFVNLNYYIEKVKDKLYTRDYFSMTTYLQPLRPCPRRGRMPSSWSQAAAAGWLCRRCPGLSGSRRNPRWRTEAARPHSSNRSGRTSRRRSPAGRR